MSLQEPSLAAGGAAWGLAPLPGGGCSGFADPGPPKVPSTVFHGAYTICSALSPRHLMWCSNSSRSAVLMLRFRAGGGEGFVRC